MKYLAIDPGDSTGWASFDEKGNLTGFDKIKGHDEFLDFLEKLEPRLIILENYKIRPTVGHNFSDVPTLQLIGAIKRFAHKKGTPIVEQTPNNMYIGLRYIGFYEKYAKHRSKTGKMVQPHVPDNVSAWAHGEYYLVKNGIKSHRLDVT